MPARVDARGDSTLRRRAHFHAFRIRMNDCLICRSAAKRPVLRESWLWTRLTCAAGHCVTCHHECWERECESMHIERINRQMAGHSQLKQIVSMVLRKAERDRADNKYTVDLGNALGKFALHRDCLVSGCKCAIVEAESYQEGEIGARQIGEYGGGAIVFQHVGAGVAADREQEEEEDDPERCTGIKSDGLRCKMKVNRQGPFFSSAQL